MAEPERPVRWVRHVGFPDHPVCINAEDFDPAIHAEWEASEDAPAKPDAPAPKRGKGK